MLYFNTNVGATLTTDKIRHLPLIEFPSLDLAP